MSWHKPVLVSEVLDGLAVESGDTVVDATAGDGGHLSVLCRRYGSDINLVGIDADSQQIKRAKRRIAEEAGGCRVHFINENFRFIARALKDAGYRQVDKILFDLGWSAHQISGAGRGFSLRSNEPLIMTYASKPDNDAVKAYDVLNTWDEDALRTIIKGYGEEQFAKRIANAIVSRRQESPIKETQDLVEIVMKATPPWYQSKRLHPATKTFQAIRMAVNDEVKALEEGLIGAMKVLSDTGRITVISFHSIEDRIVKKQFRAWKDAGKGKIITKKVIQPTAEERESNPRSRSAKLRVFQKS